MYVVLHNKPLESNIKNLPFKVLKLSDETR